jgi:ribonuclease HIII
LVAVAEPGWWSDDEAVGAPALQERREFDVGVDECGVGSGFGGAVVFVVEGVEDQSAAAVAWFGSGVHG